ncbi:MAG: NADH-quinone oxidoreductase subunit H [Chloroflexota bacterium]
MLASTLVWLLPQLALTLVAAPLLNGWIKLVKARWQSRRGPGILQPSADIAKFLTRESVRSEYASWIFRAAPYVYFGAHLAAAMMVPMIWVHPPLAAMGDAIVFVGLLALARFALGLAALDTASNFGGMGAARELAFAAMTEPALLLGLLALAVPASSTAFVDLASGNLTAASRMLAFLALFVVAIAETGRIPVDNPDTHLELTMAHEGMILEYSGRPLGLIMWAVHIKQLAIVSVLGALFFPWGIAQAGDAGSTLLGLVAFAVNAVVLGFVLAGVESSFAKLRVFRIPDLLGAAGVIAALAFVALAVVGR